MLGIGAVIVVGIGALLFALSRGNNGSKVLPTVAQIASPETSGTSVAAAISTASPTTGATASPTYETDSETC
jgi:hypothetical protein